MGTDRKSIAIAGIGETGEHLATTFAKEGHDVTLIDISAARLGDIESMLDVRLCDGHAGRTDILRRANVSGADLFIATSGSDGTNLVAALKARQMGAFRTVAVIEEVDLFESPTGIYHDWLGVDLVLNTRFLIAHEIIKLVRTRGALAVEDFAENQIEMVQFRVPRETPLAGTTLKDLPLPRGCLIVGILRDRTFMVPRGDDTVQGGDEILVIARIDHISQVESGFGLNRRGRGKTVILGGGTVGAILAKGLQGLVSDVTIIEHSRDRSDFLSKELEHTAVVLGDGTDVQLLKEEGVSSAEVFAAVSGEDEKNIIAARLAKELGADRCIALVSRPDYADVCAHLGLEVVLSPRNLVAREVRRAMMPPGGILGETPVMGGVAEFIEARATDRSRVAWQSLKEAGFPRGSVVCALYGDHGVTIPDGEAVIEPGMRAIVFCHASLRPRIEELFKS